MRKKFYNCRYDRPFKEIFLKEENKDLLKLLLEQVIEEKINNIIYNNIERNNGNIHVRRKYLDGFVEADNKKIDIEVNTVDVRVRNTTFICNLYCTYTLAGEEYDENVKIIQVNLSYGLKYEQLMRIHTIQTDEGEKFVENFTIYEINMSQIMKLWYNNDKQGINKYKYFIMLGLGLEDLKKLAKEDKKVEKYMEELIKVNANPSFIRFMTKEEDERRLRNTLRKRAQIEGQKIGERLGEKRGQKIGEKRGQKIGEKRGQKIGEKRGLERGLERGEKIGEKNGIIKVARNLLKQKLDIKLISETTGLSIKELEKL